MNTSVRLKTQINPNEKPRCTSPVHDHSSIHRACYPSQMGTQVEDLSIRRWYRCKSHLPSSNLPVWDRRLIFELSNRLLVACNELPRSSSYDLVVPETHRTFSASPPQASTKLNRGLPQFSNASSPRR